MSSTQRMTRLTTPVLGYLRAKWGLVRPFYLRHD